MYIFGFNYCCSRNRDREKSYAYVVKGVTDSETKKFLIRGFHKQSLESILIINSTLGWSRCLSVIWEGVHFNLMSFLFVTILFVAVVR